MLYYHLTFDRQEATYPSHSQKEARRNALISNQLVSGPCFYQGLIILKGHHVFFKTTFKGSKSLPVIVPFVRIQVLSLPRTV